MVLQCLAIGLELAARAWPELAFGGIALRPAASVVAWAAIVATVWSGLEYLLRCRVLIRSP
jgi:phosphatidylglycerophosphate synthase